LHMTTAARLGVIVLCAAASSGALSAQSRPAADARTDEYTRYELLTPDTSSVRVRYEVSATTEGARTYDDHIPTGATVKDVAVHDMMTGEALKFAVSGAAIHVDLARPVPPKGQGRIRIEKTVKNALAYKRTRDAATFTVPLGAGRHDLVLPAGYELIAAN